MDVSERVSFAGKNSEHENCSFAMGSVFPERACKRSGDAKRRVRCCGACGHAFGNNGLHVEFGAVHLVADATYRDHHGIEIEGAKTVPKIFEMDVHHIAGSIVFLLPDFVDDLFAAENLVFVAHEQFQDVELASAEQDRLSVDTAFSRYRVEDEGAALEDGTLLFRTPPDEGVDAGNEFSEVEGFDEIVVGTSVQSLDSVFNGVLCREHDHGNLLACLADFFDHLETVPSGEHDIKNDAVKFVLREQCQSFFSVLRSLHAESMFGESFCEHLNQISIVLDNKQFHDGSDLPRRAFSLILSFFPLWFIVLLKHEVREMSSAEFTDSGSFFAVHPADEDSERLVGAITVVFPTHA